MEKKMEKKKLSKCIITGGKELLKELGIDFQDMEVERAERTSETLKIKKEDLLKIENLLSNKKVVAIGEIGLDYYWDKDNKEEQKEWVFSSFFVFYFPY